MRYLALTVIGLLFIGLIAYGYLLPSVVENAPKTEAVYRSEVYEYTVTIPDGLAVKEYLPENVVFGHVTNDAVDGVVEVRAITVEGKNNEKFIDSVARELANLCAADGPNASLSCIGIEKSEPITSVGGLTGTELFLVGEMKQLPSGETTHITKGPYFVFQRQAGVTVSSVIVIHAPLNQSAAEADVGTIRGVAESLVIE